MNWPTVLGKAGRYPPLHASRIGAIVCFWQRTARHCPPPQHAAFRSPARPHPQVGPGLLVPPPAVVLPAADANDPMAVVYVDEGDVVWVIGPEWADLANLDRQETRLLQHCSAPADGYLSAAQAVELGFKWHDGP